MTNFSPSFALECACVAALAVVLGCGRGDGVKERDLGRAAYEAHDLKKAEKLAEQFAAVSDKSLSGYSAAFNGASIDTARFVNFNLNSVMGLGAEPKIFEAALKANPGEVITVSGKNSVVALQVLDKNDKGLNYDEQARLDAVARGREYAQAVSAALQVMQNKAQIEDNRINFY